MKHINVLCEAAEADAKNSIGYIAQTLASNNISVCSSLTISLYLKKIISKVGTKNFSSKMDYKRMIFSMIH